MLNYFMGLSIKVKLLLGFIVVLILNAAVSASIVISTLDSIAGTARINEILATANTRVNTAQTAMHDFNSTVIADLNNAISGKTDQFLKDYEQIKADLSRTSGALIPGAMGTQSYADNINAVKKAASDIISFSDSVILPLVHSNDAAEGLTYYIKQGLPIYRKAIEDYHAILIEQNRTAIGIAEDSSSMSTVYIDVALTIASIIIGLAIAMLISSYISRHISAQIEIIDKIAAGDLSQHIHHAAEDEFGYARKALRKMRNQLNEAVEGTVETSNNAMDLLNKALSNTNAMSTDGLIPLLFIQLQILDCDFSSISCLPVLDLDGDAYCPHFHMFVRIRRAKTSDNDLAHIVCMVCSYLRQIYRIIISDIPDDRLYHKTGISWTPGIFRTVGIRRICITVEIM